VVITTDGCTETETSRLAPIILAFMHICCTRNKLYMATVQSKHIARVQVNTDFAA